MSPTLDADLRVHDFDRWLSSRFVADPEARERLVALYTLDGEWARAEALAKAPLAAELRLAWWSEALARFASGCKAEHPALDALGRDAARDLEPLLQSVIEARRLGLSGGGPDFARIDAGGGALMTAAARLLDPLATVEAVRDAARAWDLARHRRTGEAVAALASAQVSMRALSPAAFPAAAHVALVRAYAGGGTPGPLQKRALITLAVLRGRL